MTFSNDKPIYLQMADLICNDILSGMYKDGDRIPSMRDFAAELGVNTNTAVKAYEELSRSNVIYNQRGLGYFVCEGALEQIRKSRRQMFLGDRLERFFHDMQLLGITMEEVAERWQTRKQ